MKKKVLSLILVCAMFAALAVPAMAADQTAPGDYRTAGCNDPLVCDVETIIFVPVPQTDICIDVPCNWTVELIAQYFYGTASAAVVQALRDVNVAHFLMTGGILEAGRVFILPSSVAGVNRIRNAFLPANTILAARNNVRAITGTNAIFYWVKSGDTLTKIVKTYYPGFPTSLIMPFIFQANKALGFMSNINKLSVGQVIYLPEIMVTA